MSFFPQLVAGPIERASKLLPQFFKKRSFNHQHALSGVELIIWGFFKKVVIADNCAIYVNEIFENHQDQSGLTLALGALYFSFQIYGDFSGYSDIAIGTARLLGFDLSKNFNYPYFSRDIAEFWRRWHISLSSWFRDYLYIPLGGSRGGRFQQIRNVFIIFLISGFWHGANWTFIFWGGINAALFIPVLLTNNNRKNLNIVAKNSMCPSIKETVQILITFTLTCLAWIFFRATSIQESFSYLGSLFNSKDFLKIDYLPNVERYSVEILHIIFVFVLYEWFCRNKETPFKGKFRLLNKVIVLVMIFVFGVFYNSNSFIYFQF